MVLCVAARHAAEKALKGALQKRNMEGWGHSATALCQFLGQELTVPEELPEACKRLDKYYIPARYPRDFPSGATSRAT